MENGKDCFEYGKPGEPWHAKAEHSKSETEQTVTVGPLLVYLTNDDGAWFAQSLQLDYFAQGNTLEDVQDKFSQGLYETINLHLKLYGDITRLLAPAAKEDWVEFFANKWVQATFNQESVHPAITETFGGIEFAKKAA